MAIEVGSVLEGIVTGITPFGAFVELPDKKVGLVHISEVANEYVKDVHDFLKVQDKVNVKVLSIKRTLPAPEKKEVHPKREFHRRNANPGFDGGHRQGTGLSFEDRLSKFLKESDERQMDLRRNTESKRGGRGARHAD